MFDVVINAKNITKIYKLYNDPKDRFREAIFKNKKIHTDHYALRDISFQIGAGETLGIIGQNGSGKSTLLKIITGVLNQTSGSVDVNGRVSALLELGAGFNPEYTGIENIFFNGMVMGFSKKEMEEKLNFIIGFADIGDFIYQPVKTYSSGMYVRLAYSVAVSIEPDILIVDEALSVGDAFFQMKSMTKMQELFDKGKTVLFVTHDTSVVKSLCTRAIYLEHGRIIADGPSKEVVELYEMNIREKMSEMSGGEPLGIKAVFAEHFASVDERTFKENPSFGYRVKDFREGNGDAIVTELELLNMNDEPITNAGFDQSVKIRMHIKYIRECELCVGYHIRDDKNMPILGSNTIIEDYGEIRCQAGERIIVDFITRVPLWEGTYNIMTVLSKTTILNRSVQFVDVTKNGLAFKVGENKKARIWNKVYIPNQVSTYIVKGEQ